MAPKEIPSPAEQSHTYSVSQRSRQRRLRRTLPRPAEIPSQPAHTGVGVPSPAFGPSPAACAVHAEPLLPLDGRLLRQSGFLKLRFSRAAFAGVGATRRSGSRTFALEADTRPGGGDALRGIGFGTPTT